MKKRKNKRTTGIARTGIAMMMGLMIVATPMSVFASPGQTTPVPPTQKKSIQQPRQPGNQLTPGTQNQRSPAKPPGPSATPNLGATAKLKVTVIDGRTRQPLSNAEVVLGETEQRFRTDAKGETPWIDAPIIRDERFRPMIAQLHGQLTLITYKNGYRDTIYFNVRVHDGIESRVTVWMYKIAPGEDRRIEPLAYETPYHHLWLVQLADKFRSSTQPGEGPERP
jgi:hypothetical protein